MTDPTTGTVEQNGGDAQNLATAGTSDSIGRNADEDKDARIAKLEQEKAQALAEKQSLEALKRENEDLKRAQANAPPTAGVDPLMANVSAYYREVVAAAQRGEAWAQYEVAKLQGQQAELARIRQDAQLAALGDRRGAVEKMLERKPGISVEFALELVEAEVAREKLKQYEDREADDRRRAEEAARAGNAGVTNVRPAPPSDNKPPMKASEFQRQVAAYLARGDQKGRDEALKLQRQVDSGAIALVLNE